MRILIFILFILPAIAFSQATNIREVFIIAGQSNADGRNNGIPSVAEADSSVADIIMYNYSTGVLANWKYGTNGGAFTNTSVSFGFDVFALTAWRDSINDTVYVLKATRGGTSMAADENNTGSWSLDEQNIQAGASMMAKQLKERMERVRILNAREGYVTRFKAVLWHQGEQDYAEPEASAYEANMTAFIAQVRKWAWDSTMPFIAGTVPTNSTYYSATVKTAMDNIAASDPYYHLINLGSRTLPDNVHWDEIEAAAIGLLYYNKLTEIF